MAARATLKLVALAAVATLLASSASGHRLAPSLLELREGMGADGELRVDVLWKASLLVPTGAALYPELPEHCRRDGEAAVEREASAAILRFALACGERGLVGARVGVAGLDVSRTDVLLRVELADGRRVDRLLRAGAPSLVIPARARFGDVLRDYVRLGADHIATGLDHLLFVLALVLLVAGGRRLLEAVTAFTLGHSATLALAALGFVRFPGALVELAIAASILVLASELARGETASPSALRRRPWVLCFGFGLLHGLGFAGALSEIGLPAEAIPLALFAFNVGIELGQLAFVAAVLAARELWRRGTSHRLDRLAPLPAYGIGSLAAYWCFERGAALLGL